MYVQSTFAANIFVFPVGHTASAMLLPYRKIARRFIEPAGVFGKSRHFSVRQNKNKKCAVSVPRPRVWHVTIEK
jgi:hypothetical protein